MLHLQLEGGVPAVVVKGVVHAGVNVHVEVENKL